VLGRFRLRAAAFAAAPWLTLRVVCALPPSHARLAIKGIRSFGPEHAGVITFPKPLTLIVGRNGSGKTVRGQRPRRA
jgi:hypothetical protein